MCGSDTARRSPAEAVSKDTQTIGYMHATRVPVSSTCHNEGRSVVSLIGRLRLVIAGVYLAVRCFPPIDGELVRGRARLKRETRSNTSRKLPTTPDANVRIRRENEMRSVLGEASMSHG